MDDVARDLPLYQKFYFPPWFRRLFFVYAFIYTSLL